MCVCVCVCVHLRVVCGDHVGLSLKVHNYITVRNYMHDEVRLCFTMNGRTKLTDHIRILGDILE